MTPSSQPDPRRRGGGHRRGDPSSRGARPPQQAIERPGDPTHWEHVAGWYDQLVGEQGSEYHRKVVIPGVLKLLGLSRPVAERRKKRTAPAKAASTSSSKARRVLDLACGQGVLSRAMAHRGCEVVGVDAAPALIEAARAWHDAGDAAIHYVVGDAAKLDELTALTPASFDAITCVLAIQNMAVLSPVWRGCARLLVPGGRLVVVMMHPCFRVPKASHWGWDATASLAEKPVRPGGATSQAPGTPTPSPLAKPRPGTSSRPASPAAPSHSSPSSGVEYRRVDRYLSSAKTPIQIHPGSDPSLVAQHFHRPMQAYVNTLAESGLLIDRLEEWPSHKRSEPANPKARAHDRARAEFPMFLALRARASGLPGED